MARKPSQLDGAPNALVTAALGDLVGAAIVLDEELRVVESTEQAQVLLGIDLPRGVAAVKLLCGHAVKRPIADALSAGRNVDAVIPAPSGDRLLRVRAVRFGQSAARRGWLLLVSDEQGGVVAEQFHGMWTQDAATKRLFRLVERAARSEATVLVRGETGSGKERVAEALHRLSRRHNGAFRALNCAAMPQALLESELFGHVKGAFTGALRDTDGLFASAHGGTLFLDEVAEMPLDVQAKMLRVLETGEYTPVGGREARRADVRIVAATHRALRQEVEAGTFRADLMYRLRVIPLFLPPLRERGEDVILLATKLIETMNESNERQVLTISACAAGALRRHEWPGNVRELKNALAFAYVMGDGRVLVETDLPPELSGGRPTDTVVAAPEPRRSPEIERIRRAVQQAAGNRARAAKSLGMSRVTLWRKMKELGLAEE